MKSLINEIKDKLRETRTVEGRDTNQWKSHLVSIVNGNDESLLSMIHEDQIKHIMDIYKKHEKGNRSTLIITELGKVVYFERK